MRRPGPDPLPRRPRSALLTALVGAVGLAGCASLGPGVERPSSPIAPARPAESVPADPVSSELARHYAAIESERLSRGLMRSDRGVGVPVSASQLAETYIDVALRDEHLRGRSGSNVLRRWQEPVRYSLEFGPATRPAARSRDRAEVAQLASRLAAASGHPVSLAAPGGSGNFHVLVLSEAERRAAGPRLRALVPGIDDSAVRLITDMPRETFCLVIAFARGTGAVYSEAIAVIRAEHPTLTRRACYHEELTQGLGLASDSDRARPSIFNDNQEYALLTDHDLLLLRLHYDARLRPGMVETAARPLIFTIASELAPGES